MPWVPTTDFEEEVVNLQPRHDFIYGAFPEPQFSYPRPKAHTEYAANKKLQYRKQQKEHQSTGKINGKLHAIQTVHRMVNTKPVGEQPAVDDWENYTNIEQETIGMMRYCGMGVSVDHPFNQEVTIATYPIENYIKVVHNGRRKVALFFDENVFRLKEKVSDASSGLGRCNNSGSYRFEKSENVSLASKPETKTSLVTSAAWQSLNSFTTAEDVSDSCSSVSSSKKSPFKNSQSDLTDDISSEASSNNHAKGSSLLDRFIKSENFNTSNTSETSRSTTSSQEPNTYICMLKPNHNH